MFLTQLLLATPNMVKFFGHFHVLLVHVPIGILTLLAAMEITGRFKRWQHITAGRGFILLLLALAVVPTAVCGWLLASGGGYGHTTLAWHRWLGTGVGVLCVAMLAVFWWKKKPTALYYALLAPAFIVMVAAAHFGGDLTFGSRYLGKYAPEFLRPMLGYSAQAAVSSTKEKTPLAQTSLMMQPIASVAAAGSYAVLPVSDESPQSFYSRYIQTIFTHDCTRCHGHEKRKGHLRLDSYKWVMYGSRGRHVVVPRHPRHSKLYQLITLPLWQRHHMPPHRRRQLTRDQIALIHFWIESGASGTATLQSLHPSADITRIINRSANTRRHDEPLMDRTNDMVVLATR
ncbi:MAG: hypothetical protein HKL96_08225 [Phycisphaerales bacterium]|nr:hypothetical protein [Phycisphaerales bacterium]